MNAHKILEGIANTYHTCRSYSDRGRLRTSSNGEVAIIEFKTSFASPRLFKFEWTEENQKRFLIGSDGNHIFEQYDFDECKTLPVENLELAIAGATGISYGAAWIIPSLLMPELGAERQTLLRLKDLVLLDDEDLFGSQCYVLKGSLNPSDETTVWVTQKEFRVRRVREKYETTPAQYRQNTEHALASVVRLREQGKISIEEASSFQTAVHDAKFDRMSQLKECNYEEVQFDQEIPPDTFSPRV